MSGAPRANNRSNKWPARLAVLILASLIAIIISCAFDASISRLENSTYDAAWMLSHNKKNEDDIIIIDISEDSIKQIGPWPWAREDIAYLSQTIAALGARVQVFDIVFNANRTGDDKLREALNSTQAVLPVIFGIEEGMKEGQTSGTLSDSTAGIYCLPNFPNAHTYISNNKSFSTIPSGHITPNIGLDGIIRSTSAIICHNGKAYSALGISAVIETIPGDHKLTHTRGKGWLSPEIIIESSSGMVNVPTNQNGEVLIPFRIDRQSLTTIPAHDVIQGNIKEDAIRGKIVIIGSSAIGLSDTVSTPLSTISSGYEVHAALISGLLDNRIPYVPQGEKFIIALISIIGAAIILLTTNIKGRSKIIAPVLLSTCLSIIAVIAYKLALSELDLRISWTYTTLNYMIAGIALSMLEHYFSRKERDLVFANFSSYLPKQAADQLAFKKPRDQIMAEKISMTVWIADIRNYSRYCENHDPMEAAKLLHDFFVLTTRIVEKRGGVVENLAGDSVIALWCRSGKCIREALDAAEQLTSEWRILQNIDKKLSDDLSVGIGIEAGSVILGSIGPTNRRLHTALGETVSVADRLQGFTAELLEPILIGPNAASLLSPESVREIGEFLLEDLDKPRRIFAPRNKKYPT